MAGRKPVAYVQLFVQNPVNQVVVTVPNQRFFVKLIHLILA
jgi:hypothetical protein